MTINDRGDENVTRRLEGHPLPEQFAALPPDLQSRLFRLTDILNSMDPEQGKETQDALSALAGSPLLAERPFLRGLLAQLSHIVMWAGLLEEQEQIDDAVARLTGEGDLNG